MATRSVLREIVASAVEDPVSERDLVSTMIAMESESESAEAYPLSLSRVPLRLFHFADQAGIHR